jgi:hypothetical protein
MNGKHTPGDWWADAAPDFHDWPMEQIIVYDEKGGCICEVDCHTSAETTIANAYLIVASPKLLAVAEELVNFSFDQQRSSHGYDKALEAFCAIKRKATLAIAQAAGKAQQ